MSLADKQIPPLAHASRQRPRTPSRDELVLQKAQRNAKKAKAQREFLPSNIDVLCMMCGRWHQGKKIESCKSGCGTRLLYIPKILKPWRILSDQYGYEAANFACRGMCRKTYFAWRLFGCDCPNERRDFERHPVLYYCRICCYNYKTGQRLKLDDVFRRPEKRPEMPTEQRGVEHATLTFATLDEAYRQMLTEEDRTNWYANAAANLRQHTIGRRTLGTEPGPHRYYTYTPDALPVNEPDMVDEEDEEEEV